MPLIPALLVLAALPPSAPGWLLPGEPFLRPLVDFFGRFYLILYLPDHSNDRQARKLRKDMRYVELMGILLG